MEPAETEPRTRRESAKARATRDSLIEMAARLFAGRGYGQTSIRDISRMGSVTSGAIYGHFRNKADLLAAAISRRTATDLDQRAILEGEEGAFVAALARLALEYPARHELRALILEGAAAARTDAETRTLLKAEQESYLDRWLAQYEDMRLEMGIDPSVDMRAALLYTWAAELGLGVLEALGVDLPEPRGWSVVQSRVARSWRLPADESAPPAPGPVRRSSAAPAPDPVRRSSGAPPRSTPRNR